MALAADGEPRRVVPAVARPVACTTAAAALEGGDVESRADCDDAGELRRLTRVKVIACERIAESRDERPCKRQPTEAEMQRLRAECDEIRESMAMLKGEHAKIQEELRELKSAVGRAATPIGFARFAENALHLSRAPSKEIAAPLILE